MPDSVANYLRETARVLRPGGIACTTWFWFGEDYTNDYAKTFARSDDTALLEPKNPEAAIAYRSDLVAKMFDDAGLTPELIPGFMFQDLAVGTKR